MKLTALALFCVALSIALMACTQSAPTNSAAPVAATSPAISRQSPSPAATPDELSLARANFAKNCESCHGEKGEGGLVKVDNKRLKVPSFKAEHAMKHPDEDFIKQITKGGDGMPSFKDKLSEAEMRGLVKFIRTEFQGK
jgi:mono/diheme cytochrome c family protein